MKLNKMLALALSGVMAVSMLAGCSGAPSNGEEGKPEEPVADTTIAGVFNDKLEDKDIHVISFNYDTKVEDAAKQIALANGGLTTDFVKNWSSEENNAKKLVANMLGIDSAKELKMLSQLGSQQKTFVVGDEYAISIKLYEGVTSEKAMKNATTDMIDNWVASSGVNLEKSKTTNGLKYDFTYTGKVAMISEVDDGVPVYAVIAVVQCNTAAPVKA